MTTDTRSTNEYDHQAIKGLHAGHLFQHYRPLKELGRGPLSTVYRAVDQENGQLVALKLFDARFHYEPRFAIRFRHHLKALVGLNHEHLVNIRDYGLAGDHFYIVAELVEGQNLATLLAEQGELLSVSTEITRLACLGLAAAHEQGLVHRNLKPENILLSESGQVKVADVGLSGLLSESGLSRTSVMLHGAVYMAPEQARGLAAGPSADIYSLGVILFQLATGRPPFDSTDLWSIVQMHLQADPPLPRALNPAIPPQLEDVALRALQKEPDQRFATASEMAAALGVGAGILELIPALLRPQDDERSADVPPVFRRARDRARRLAAKATGADPRQRVRRFAILLALQFIASFAVFFFLFLAISGQASGSSPPVGASGEAQQQSIVKPMPKAVTATVTSTPTLPTSTPTTEPTPTVAAARQAPAGGGQTSKDSGRPEGGGPPPWAGGPPPWARGPEKRGKP